MELCKGKTRIGFKKAFSRDRKLLEQEEMGVPSRAGGNRGRAVSLGRAPDRDAADIVVHRVHLSIPGLGAVLCQAKQDRKSPRAALTYSRYQESQAAENSSQPNPLFLGYSKGMEGKSLLALCRQGDPFWFCATVGSWCYLLSPASYFMAH